MLADADKAFVTPIADKLRICFAHPLGERHLYLLSQVRQLDGGCALTGTPLISAASWTERPEQVRENCHLTSYTQPWTNCQATQCIACHMVLRQRAQVGKMISRVRFPKSRSRSQAQDKKADGSESCLLGRQCLEHAGKGGINGAPLLGPERWIGASKALSYAHALLQRGIWHSGQL